MSGPSSSDPGIFEIAGEIRERRGHIWLYLAKSSRKGAQNSCLHPVGHNLVMKTHLVANIVSF